MARSLGRAGLWLAVALSLAACSRLGLGGPSTPAGLDALPPEQIFLRGEQFLEQGREEDAAFAFSEIERLYPYSEWARRGLVMAAFAFHRDGQYENARAADLETMWSRGLALGGTPLNAVVVDGPRVLTPGGWRHADEAVRHKMLDAVGDLATAGLPILGRYVGRRAGHAVTNLLLRALFARPSAWRRVDCDADLLARLPGTGRRGGDLADLPAVA